MDDVMVRGLGGDWGMYGFLLAIVLALFKAEIVTLARSARRRGVNGNGRGSANRDISVPGGESRDQAQQLARIESTAQDTKALCAGMTKLMETNTVLIQQSHEKIETIDDTTKGTLSKVKDLTS